MTEGNEISLIQLGYGLWRRKRVVAVTTAIVFTAVTLFTLLAQKTYVSEAALFVRLGRENARLDVTTTLGQTPGLAVPLQREVEINSVAELIGSRELLESMVDYFGVELILEEGLVKAQDDPGKSESILGSLKTILKNLGVLNDVAPRELALQKIGKRLHAEPVKETTLIRISYESYDPQFSQAFLEQLVNRYIDYHVKVNRPQNAPEFLEQQLQTVGDKLRAQEVELDQLKTDTELYAFDDQRRLLAQNMAGLQEQRDNSLAEQEAYQSEVDSLRRRLDELPTTKSLSTTTGAGNEGVDGMRQQFFELQIEYQRILADYTPDHPRAVRIKQQIDQANAIVDKAEAERTQVVSGPNQIYEAIRTDLIRKESALAAVKARIESIDQSMQRLRVRLNQFIQNERKYRQLQREIVVNETTYQNYSNNLEQARIDRELEQRQLSNLSISDHASLNLAPASPNKKLNLVAGLVLGMMLGSCIALLQEILALTRSSSLGIDSNQLTLPVVARIPMIEMIPETQEG